MSFPISRQDYNVAQSPGQTLSAQMQATSMHSEACRSRNTPPARPTTASAHTTARSSIPPTLPPNTPQNGTHAHPKTSPEKRKKFPTERKKNTYTQNTPSVYHTRTREPCAVYVCMYVCMYPWIVCMYVCTAPAGATRARSGRDVRRGQAICVHRAPRALRRMTRVGGWCGGGSSGGGGGGGVGGGMEAPPRRGRDAAKGRK